MTTSRAEKVDSGLIITSVKVRFIWCLMLVWLAYSGLMLWHLKERSGWVANICRTQQ